jgi:hypothetical protein
LVIHLKRALTDPEDKPHESAEHIHAAEVNAGEVVGITQTFAPKQLEIIPKFQVVEVEDAVLAVTKPTRGVRKWMSMMDRNAAANFGASCHIVCE